MQKEFKIYQVKEEFIRDYGFVGLDYLKKIEEQVKIERYNKVYEGSREDKEDFSFLRNLFFEFNMNHPQDYTGRSLSVGDIVQLGNKFYFCDRFGWELIELK